MSVHALWSHPRSVSTAFERVMRARGDLRVLHEPFMYHYYLSHQERLFPDFEPLPGHPQTFVDIRAMILDLSAHQPLFFKDMAYYIADVLPGDHKFMSAMTHTFLIRDPAQAILSYHKRDPNFTCTELGYEAQHKVFCAVREAGLDPLVLTADQLRADPQKTMRRYWGHIGLPFIEQAFNWDDTVPQDWKAVAKWHDDVLRRGAIEPAHGEDASHDQLAALGTPYTNYDAHHRPYYQALLTEACRQAA